MPNQHTQQMQMVMNTKEAARYVGLSEGALSMLKTRGRGPKSFSYGSRDVRYLVSELEAWVLQKAGVKNDKSNADNVPKTPAKKGRRRKTKTFPVVIKNDEFRV